MKLNFFYLICLFSTNVAFSQVGIGTSTPNANSILELSATNKGFLPTRVSLVETTNASPLASHVQGMVVYNTATVNDVTPGLYLNSGSSWERLINTNVFVPHVVAAVRNNGTQNVPTGANVNMVFPTADSTDGNYNTTTSTYTVPADGAGYYSVTVKAKHDVNGSTSSYAVRIEAGTQTSTIIQVNNQPDAFPSSRSGTATFRLVPGETIKTTIQTCVGTCNTTVYAVSEATMVIQLVGK